MSDPARSDARTYEIGFEGDDLRDLLGRVVPEARVLSTQRCTVLWQHISEPTEFDALLDALLDVGITPIEVHGSPGRRTYCEVRINGRLGEAMLRHLRWSHRVIQTTVVRVRLRHEQLSDLIADISSTARLDYMLAL